MFIAPPCVCRIDNECINDLNYWYLNIKQIYAQIIENAYPILEKLALNFEKSLKLGKSPI